MPQTRFTKEFQDEAVRLALTSGRSRPAMAADLGVGLSPLRQEREILTKATAFSPRRPRRQGGKSMKFRFIDAAKEEFPVRRHATLDRFSPVPFERLAQ
jgi:transposase